MHKHAFDVTTAVKHNNAGGNKKETENLQYFDTLEVLVIFNRIIWM